MGSYHGSYRQRPGMQTPPDRPQAIAPVPENYVGVNFPYRGIGTHGVVPTQDVDPEEYYDHTSYDMNPDNFKTLPPEKEPEPVPVKIVNDSARERYMFRTQTLVIPVGSDVVQLVGRNDRRNMVRLRIPGSSAGSIIFGGDRNLSVGFGYTMATGTELEFRTTEPVYVVAANTAQAPTVMVLETYSVQL